VTLGAILAKAAGRGAEYDLLRRYRALPGHLQQDIVAFGKHVYERWSGGILPPGPMDEGQLYRLYLQLPELEQARIRRKGKRVYAAWKRAQTAPPPPVP